MPAVHLSETELLWLLQHARAFGPEWFARRLELESPEHRTRVADSQLVHRARTG